MNHGHVTPNPDGSKARCGGPALCETCGREALQASMTKAGGQTPPHIRITGTDRDNIKILVNGIPVSQCFEFSVTANANDGTPGSAVVTLKMYAALDVDLADVELRQEVMNAIGDTRVVDP